MIHYRDMTFCSSYKECRNGKKCNRALTPQVQKDADKWWGKGTGQAPICQFVDKPECYKEKKS